MEDSQVIEAILALASAVSGKDKTDSQVDSVDAALEVLSSVVSDSSMEGNESIYEAAQFATNRSTDTDSAAGAILALAQYVGGGGGGGSTEYAIECYDDTGAKVPSYVYAATVVHEDGSYFLSVDTSAAIDSAEAGAFVMVDPDAVTGDDWYFFINVKQSDMENPVFLQYAQGNYNGLPESPDDYPKQWVGCIMPAQKLFVYTASWQ